MSSTQQTGQRHTGAPASSTHPVTRHRQRSRAQYSFSRSHTTHQQDSKTEQKLSNNSQDDDDNDADDEDFLLSAAERRAKHLLRDTQSEKKEQVTETHTDTTIDTSSITRHPPIPGYYYDKQKQKYFKLTLGHEFTAERKEQHRLSLHRQQQQRQQQREQQERTERSTLTLSAQDDPTYAAVVLSHPSSSSSVYSSLWNRSLQPIPHQSKQQLSSALFSLLTPCSLFPNTGDSRRMHALSSFPVSGDAGLSYDAASNSLSVCGRIVEQVEDSVRDDDDAASGLRQISPLPKGSFHNWYQLHVPSQQTITGRTVVGDEGDDVTSDSQPDIQMRSAPFTAELIQRHSTTSPITSCHQLHRHGQFPLVCETVLGEAQETGAFRLFDQHEDNLRWRYQLPNSSAYSSSPSPALQQGTGALAAVAAHSGVVLLDCLAMKARMLWCDKGDVLSVRWSPDEGEQVFYAGSRAGVLFKYDTRTSGKKHPDRLISLGSALTWIHVLEANTQQLMTATSTGNLALYDTRKLASSSSSSSQSVLPVVTYHGHQNEYTAITGCLTSNDQQVVLGGTDSRVRIWSVQSGALCATLAPRPTDFSLMSNRCSTWHGRHPSTMVRHVIWMEKAQAMLLGSEAGVACYTVR